MNKRKHTLIKFLRICCVICEVSAVLGLLVGLLMFPVARTLIDRRQASISLSVGHGSPDWAFQCRLPHSTDGNFTFDRSGQLSTKVEYGNISFGPFRLGLEPALLAPGLEPVRAQAVVVDAAVGTVTIRRPERAAEVLGSVQGPFLVGMLCTGAVSLAILESLRRMFRSAERDEVFTAANIRHVRQIGYLLIASGVLKALAAGWLAQRMAAYVMEHVAAGKVSFDSLGDSDGFSLIMGLMVLALAEVFRQGLSLKEESQFTV
jgi:Protein of unknown function (DUF2975)